MAAKADNALAAQIERFLDHLLHGRNASSATVRAYGSDLGSFRSFLEASRLPTHPRKVDPLAIKLARLERIPLVTTKLDIEELSRRLRKLI